MCKFCEDAKIIREDYTEYSYLHMKRVAILENARRTTIKFEEMNPLKSLENMENIRISFCPICGRNLTETKDNAEMKPIIHAHAIINWLGDAHCSNCGYEIINTNEPYCQHCGADIDENMEWEE